MTFASGAPRRSDRRAPHRRPATREIPPHSLRRFLNAPRRAKRCSISTLVSSTSAMRRSGGGLERQIIREAKVSGEPLREPPAASRRNRQGVASRQPRRVVESGRGSGQTSGLGKPKQDNPRIRSCRHRRASTTENARQVSPRGHKAKAGRRKPSIIATIVTAAQVAPARRCAVFCGGCGSASRRMHVAA